MNHDETMFGYELRRIVAIISDLFTGAPGLLDGLVQGRTTILNAAVSRDSKIFHIGSTAVKTIWAKPIIDILVELPKEDTMAEYKDRLFAHGYTCMSQSAKRLSFNKGYTPNGFAQKVFHLHLRYMGDHDELYFRDYLNDHADIARQYEAMKLKLWKKFEHNRDAYTEAKTDFIKRYTDIAKLEYKNRY